MSEKHPEETTTSVKADGRFFSLKLPSKYVAPFCIAIGLGYNPARDAISAALPQRGAAAREVVAARNDSDNAKIIDRLGRIESLNQDIASLSGVVSALNESVKDLKQDVRDLNKRVDTIKDRP